VTARASLPVAARPRVPEKCFTKLLRSQLVDDISGCIANNRTLAKSGYRWRGVGRRVCNSLEAIPNSATGSATAAGNAAAANRTAAGVHGAAAAASTTAKVAVRGGVAAQNAATDASSGSFGRSKQNCANSAAFGGSHAASRMQRLAKKSDCQDDGASAQGGKQWNDRGGASMPFSGRLALKKRHLKILNATGKTGTFLG
jgi:hypothetical protein